LFPFHTTDPFQQSELQSSFTPPLPLSVIIDSYNRKKGMASFSSTELATALSELGWGLLAWSILPSSFSSGPHESRAKLELLEEGDEAVVSLSEREGWRIRLRTVRNWSVRSFPPLPLGLHSLPMRKLTKLREK
jgi:hypothetical protein